ncbi:hypothetical protein C2S52_009878 [Perilla frutescens var. hirtella]|nr:hypothetical protein C2S52_009878 [Perilla frutescens var. hirtella]
MKDGTLSISSVIVSEENVRIEVVDESGDEEEDVIELEFEKAVDKLHTHTPYCPNCSKQITKVILRRKRRRQPSNLLGCFNCFTVFIPSGGGLNPFGFLKSKSKLEGTKVEDVQPSIYGGGTTTNAAELENPKVEGVQSSIDVGGTTTNAAGLNPFNCFGSKPKLESFKVEDEHPSTEVVIESTTSNAAVGSSWSVYNLFSINGKREKKVDQNEEILEREDQEGEAKPEINPTHDVTIDIGAGTGVETNIHEGGEIEQPLINSSVQRSTSFEILKCIVYGGLIESITSLSIVSSAVASDVPTLNVVAIGLASVFSGLIIFGCNLLELRNEATPNDKYQELLGRRGNFLLHSTFAIFSYLVYGLIAPTTYGFAFHESDNKDYKLIAVAAAAIACIFILSIAKAYVVETENFIGYVKTISYYVTVAVGASGLAYAAGDLFGMLLHDFGWFQSAQDVTPLDTPTWVSY